MELKEIYPGVIWSIQLSGESDSVFKKLMLLWRKKGYIEAYIERHEKFITGDKFWSDYDILKVTSSARNELTSFLKRINECYTNTLNGEHPDFDDTFVILNDNSNIPEEQKRIDMRRKMYGKDDRPSVFRLYAIKVESEKENEPPAFVVTGGAIKLSHAMANMKELNRELNMMASVKQWLAGQGITTKEKLLEINSKQNG